MKPRKQWMIALLIFSLLIVGVNYSGRWIKAADTPQIYAQTVSVSAGDEISIPVLIRDNLGIMGIAIKAVYDQSVLTPIKVERGKLLTGLEGQFGDTISVSTDNSFETVWTGVDNFTGDGELYIMTFQVADQVSVASTSIALSYTESDTFNESFAEIALDCQDILLTVGNMADTPSQQPTVKVSFDVSIGYAATDFAESIFGTTENYVTVKGDGDYEVSYTASQSTPDIHVLMLDTNLPLDDVPQGMTMAATKLTIGSQEYILGTCDVTNDENRNYRIGIRNPYDGAVSNRALGNIIIPVTAGDTITVYFTVSGTGVQNPDAQIQPTPPASAAPQKTPATSISSTTNTDDSWGPTTSTKVKEVSKPGKVKVKSCKSKKKGRITVKWKKVSKAEAYQIQYSTKRSFAGKKIKTVYGKSGTLRVKSKKKYYVRVRAYRYGNIKFKVYGKWSKVKKVRVK